jgi:hypothetical protein
MIFLTGSFFLYFYYLKEHTKVNHNLENIENKITSLNKIQLTNIINQLNEISLLNIVDSVVGSQEKPETQFLKDNF